MIDYSSERAQFEAWNVLYGRLCLDKSDGDLSKCGQYINYTTQEAWDTWWRVAKEREQQLAELRAKLDICKRYAEGEWRDPVELAISYGGTGWEKDPACVAVSNAVSTPITIPDGFVIAPRQPTPDMVAAAEEVEDLYRRGTPNTWATVYKNMLRERPNPYAEGTQE